MSDTDITGEACIESQGVYVRLFREAKRRRRRDTDCIHAQTPSPAADGRGTEILGKLTAADLMRILGGPALG